MRRGAGLAILSVLALVIAFAGVAWPATACVTPSKPNGLATATVERVSDGDTVWPRLSDGRRERTRLLGIDAPDRDVARTGQDRAVLLALGRRASAFARQLLPQGATVEVEHDLRARDRHGRLLAYFWTTDGAMVNLVILREGHARVLTGRPSLRYEAVFFACQREAREAGRGLWGQQ